MNKLRTHTPTSVVNLPLPSERNKIEAKLKLQAEKDNRLQRAVQKRANFLAKRSSRARAMGDLPAEQRRRYNNQLRHLRPLANAKLTPKQLLRALENFKVQRTVPIRVYYRKNGTMFRKQDRDVSNASVNRILKLAGPPRRGESKEKRLERAMNLAHRLLRASRSGILS